MVIYFLIFDANAVMLSRCVRMVDGTAQREAGTFPQQLRHQDLGAAGCQNEERGVCCVPSDPIRGRDRAHGLEKRTP